MNALKTPVYLVMLWLLTLASAHAGSPFYLTAERSFTHTESPQLRLDYTVTDQPLLVRVLKPKNLESFLDGQLNLSRSYEQPVSELNPGYYFAKGLNNTQSPLKLLRGMVDSKFRKSLQGTAFNKAIINVTSKPLATVPQQILVAPPQGFSVVKESYLDLQRNGETAHDMGWWFANDSWSEQRYKIRQLTLEPLPDGIYLVQAVQGKTEAQCLIQISSLAVQVKQSSEQLQVRVIDRDLKPVANANISYRDARGKWQAVPQATDAAGEINFNNPEGLLDGKLVVRVDAPMPANANPQTQTAKPTDKPAQPAAVRTALTATDFLPTQAKDDAVFILTDRPIFKPGETFFYKGIVRQMNDGQLQIPKFQNPQAKVSLLYSDGHDTDLHGEVKLSDFGTFSGRFDLDGSQIPGLYRLLAEIDNKAYGGEFRVRDYIKPTFYLEFVEHSPTVTPGQAFDVKFRAKRYSGGIPQNVKFEVFLYRKKFEAPQFVAEAGGSLSAGHDYFGEVKSAAPLTQPQRVFSSIQEREAAESTNPWESAPLIDDNGDGEFSFTIPAGDKDKPDQEWIYTLMVRAQDPAGGQAILTDNLYVTLSEAQPAIRFNKTVTSVGDQDLKLLLQSSYADGKPAAKASGVVDVLLEQPGTDKRSLVKLAFTTDEQGRATQTIPALTVYGRLSAVATLEELDGRKLKHSAISQPATLIVAGNGGEAVVDNPSLELYTPTTILSPGETAKVFALLPKGWGNQENGTVWETVTGSKIFNSHGIQAQGRSRWFEVVAKPEYGTGFYHTVTVPTAGGKYREQTLGFRIVPLEKRLQIAIQPEKTETEPLKPTQIKLEVKRADGTAAANTEVALSIVDKAVYAVQAEFRPGIFDFFYPLQRNNLATFYSDDLQGYGYADLLRKPNFALSALKSQSKLTKKAMRDTAGWFPHVVTDEHGVATVTVDMPANVTQWLVTAVASDKDGRVGETTGQFSTVVDIVTDLLAPPFLRNGDEAELTVRFANHLNEAVTLDNKLEVLAPLKLVNGEVAGQVAIKAKAEQSWSLRVEADDEEGSGSVRVGLTAPAKVRVGGAEEFDIALKPAFIEQVRSGRQDGNMVRVDLSPQADVQRLKLQVNSGLLGASLQAAAMLVQYPYGCTEQLAHSTVPNLVLLDLLDKAGIKGEQLGEFANILEPARRNAATGIRKLLRNQKADGGFSLWTNESEASVPVTLIALNALKIAKGLNIEGASKAYYKAQEWLAEQKDEPLLSQGSVLAAFAESNSESYYQAPWEQQVEFVEAVFNGQNDKLVDLIDALRIVVAYEPQKWHSFNQRFKDRPSMKTDLAHRLQTRLSIFNPADYPAAMASQAELFEHLGFGFGWAGFLASGIDALDAAGALTPVLENQFKQQLLNSLEHGYWQSTYTTAQVIFHTRSLLSREAKVAALEQKNSPRKLQVFSKNNLPLGVLTRIPGGFVAEFDEFADNVDLTELRVDGLKPNEALSSSWMVAVPYQEVAAAGNGLDIQRNFYRITAKDKETWDGKTPLKIGDTVVSEVSVQRPKSTAPMLNQSQFVVIEDGIPALAEGLEADATYLADAKIQAKEDSYWSLIKETQRYPDKTVRIAEVKAGSEFKLYQVWRVTRYGNAAIPPAQVEDMYHETVRGNSAAARLVVQP